MIGWAKLPAYGTDSPSPLFLSNQDLLNTLDKTKDIQTMFRYVKVRESQGWGGGNHENWNLLCTIPVSSWPGNKSVLSSTGLRILHLKKVWDPCVQHQFTKIHICKCCFSNIYAIQLAFHIWYHYEQEGKPPKDFIMYVVIHPEPRWGKGGMQIELNK